MNKTFYIFSTFLLFVFFSACQPDSNLQADLKDTNWVGTHYFLEMPSYLNSDSTFTMEANENNWESVLKGKPSKIYLKANGEYNEEHFDVNDNRILNYQGTWSIEGDSLFFDIQKPVSTRHAYAVELGNDNSTLKLLRKSDFDRDKQVDDQQTLTFKKQ